jgi:hypothetical protein
MFRMPVNFLPVVALAMGLLGGLAAAQESSDRLAPVAHLLDAQTLAVARVDLAKVDVAELVKFAVSLAPMEVPNEEQKAAALKMRGFLVLLREYGAQDFYVVLSLADVPENPPAFVLTLKPGANVDLLESHLKSGPLLPKLEMKQLKQTLVLGLPATLDRLSQVRTVERPDLAAAFRGTGDAPVQLAAAIPADVQRVIRELLGKLPPEIGGGQGGDLLDALQWTSLAIDLPPKTSLKWIIQSKNEAAAAGLRPRILAGLNLAAQQAKLNDTIPDFADLAVRITPAVKGDRLELSLAGEELATVIKQVKSGPLSLVTLAGAKAQSVNNLKQIALAMHNYHDVHRGFPAAASYSKDGKPLLSWRVHILPYIEQQPLYNQFKLDEP